ncbi:MAG: molybdopterin-guanine dinucleotide biosynthesis protein B [Dehalococcoidia bacterium]
MSRPALVCIVGPPASGKSLLIVSLTEAFRQRGRRVASAVVRDASTTVATLPNGGRVTVARAFAAGELPSFMRALDPNVDLLLAEGFSGLGLPTVEISEGGGGMPATPRQDLLAVVSSARLIGDFAVFGPGETGGLAELIEARVLDTRKREPPPASRRRGFIDRLRRR